MTYFWSLYLNFNFCAVRSLFPDPLTTISLIVGSEPGNQFFLPSPHYVGSGSKDQCLRVVNPQAHMTLNENEGPEL